MPVEIDLPTLKSCFLFAASVFGENVESEPLVRRDVTSEAVISDCVEKPGFGHGAE